MKKTKLAFVLAAAITLFSCNERGKENSTQTAENTIKKTDWLLGEWQNNSPEGLAIEAWTKENDSTFSGKSYFIAGGDTVSAESIKLEQRGGKLAYIPTVKDQNNNQPVSFGLTSMTDKQLVFENPQHDFPQKITYTRITDDSLVAEISGTLEGKPNAQSFPLKRKK